MERVREVAITLSLILLAMGIYLVIVITIFGIGAHSGSEYRASVRLIGFAFIVIATVTLALVTSSDKGRVPREFGFRELLITLGSLILLSGLFWMLFLAVWYFRDFTDVFRFVGHLVLGAPGSLVLMIAGIVLTTYGLRQSIGAPGREVRPDIRAMTTGLALTFVGIGLIIFLPPWRMGYPPHFVLSMVGPTLVIIGTLIVLTILRRRIRRDAWSEYSSPK